METNNYTNKVLIPFGWHYVMHKDIVKNAGRNININRAINDILLESVQRPDFDEFFLYGQNHFYYPNRIIKSFLDYTGTHNAKYLYKKHIKQALKSLKTGNFKVGIDEAGRALHYLQDVTQPNHIDNGSFLLKAKEAIMPHHKFEMDIFAKQDKFYENYSRKTINAHSFSDLFTETVNISQKNQIPRKNNVDVWDDIAQNAIDLATDATIKFIEMLTSKVTK